MSKEDKDNLICKLIVAAFGLIMFLILNGGLSNEIPQPQELPDTETVAFFKSVGEAKRESVALFLEEEKALLSGKINENQIEYIGIVLGEKIRKKYYDVRYATYTIPEYGHHNPKQQAWESIKEEIYCRQFADEHNIMPTKGEITDTEYFNSLP